MLQQATCGPSASLTSCADVCPKTSEAARGPQIDILHQYLAINKVEGPPLPWCNQAVSNVYLPLLAKSSSSYSNHLRTLYVDQDHRMTTTCPPREAPYAARVQQAAARATPRCTSFLHDPQSAMTPPAADARTSPTVPVIPSAAANLVMLPQHHSSGNPRSPGDIFPKGPIGEVMKRSR